MEWVCTWFRSVLRWHRRSTEQLFARITSYNVCYTKLLRSSWNTSRIIWRPPHKRKWHDGSVSFVVIALMKCLSQQFSIGIIKFNVPGWSLNHYRSVFARITSYNVCYTKLLRKTGTYTVYCTIDDHREKGMEGFDLFVQREQFGFAQTVAGREGAVGQPDRIRSYNFV